MSDDNIDLNAKSDRELLLIAVERLNSLCHKVERIRKWKEGNGVPGAQFQLWVLWAAFLAVLAKLWSGGPMPPPAQ